MSKKDEGKEPDKKEMTDESENLTEKLEEEDLNSVVGGEASIDNCNRCYVGGVCHTESMDYRCPNLILVRCEPYPFIRFRLDFSCRKGYFKNVGRLKTVQIDELPEFGRKLGRVFGRSMGF